MTDTKTKAPTVEQIMMQAQVFASAWANTDSPFDYEGSYADAERERGELRDMVTAAIAQPTPDARQPLTFEEWWESAGPNTVSAYESAKSTWEFLVTHGVNQHKEASMRKQLLIYVLVGACVGVGMKAIEWLVPSPSKKIVVCMNSDTGKGICRTLEDINAAHKAGRQAFKEGGE